MLKHSKSKARERKGAWGTTEPLTGDNTTLPQATIISSESQLTLDQKGVVEKKVLDVRVDPIQGLGLEPHLGGIKPNFAVQIFVGEPGQGGMFIINTELINKWQCKIRETLADEYGTKFPENIDPAIFCRLGRVDVREEVHSCVIDHNVHSPSARGFCTHQQQSWHSNEERLCVSTCQCQFSLSKSMSELINFEYPPL